MMLIVAIRKRIEALYTDQRQISAGISADIDDLSVAQFLSRKVIEKARAATRGYPHAYVGRGARIRNRQSLSVGRGVVIGENAEVIAMSRDGVILGDRCTLDRGAIIRGSGGVRQLGVGVRLGKRVSIGVGAMIHGGGGVEIGDDTFISPYARIFTEHHSMDTSDVPVIEQGEFHGKVTIESDVFVGSGATILGPCAIGRGAVVAAGAVVTADVDAGTIVGGVPARVIGHRGLSHAPQDVSAQVIETAGGTEVCSRDPGDVPQLP